MNLSHGMCTLSLRDESGILRYAIDWLGTAETPGGGDPAESVQPFGFRSLPQDPDLDPEGQPNGSRGCGLILLDDGGESFAWPTQDPRYRLVLPEVPKGTAEVYATLGDGTVARLTLRGDTGDLVITTPTGATAKVKADGTLEVGGDAATALAKASLVESEIATLKASLVTAFGAQTVPFTYTPPPAGSLGATKAKSV